MEYEVGDRVMLKVSPWKRVIRFGKRGKLNSRYVRPFKVLAKVGKVAYKLKLPQELSRVYHTFHVSNLKKCYADELLVMLLEGIHVDDKLQFVEEAVEIMEREIKRLKQSRIPLVKVRWNSKRGPELTWEREDSFKQKYPQLFTNRASSSTTRGLFTQVLIEFPSKLLLEKFKSHVGVGSWFASLQYACNSFTIDERVAWVDIEEVSGWLPDFMEEEEGEDDSDEEIVDVDSEKENSNLNKIFNSEGHTECEAVSETIFDNDQVMSKQGEAKKDGAEVIHSEDPFNIYDLLEKLQHGINKEAETSDATLKYPPGFTPMADDDIKSNSVDNLAREENASNLKVHEEKSIPEVKNSRSMSPSKEEDKEYGCSSHFRRVEGPKTGGSILHLLDDLVKVGQTIGYRMDGIPNATNCLIISVYAPQEVSEKKMLWNYLNHVIDNWSGDIVVMGDFNEVRSKDERYGSLFNAHSAVIFNSFISSGGLVEVPLGGLMGSCPNIFAITLDRYLSDHRPILLREACFDYGPIPFRLFHYWFEWEGFDKFVEETWSELNISDSNAISKFMKKLKCLKEKIRLNVDQTLLNNRLHVMNSLHDLDKIESLEIAQKAKIKWSIEGDENYKYFHGILNKKRNQLAIRGILVYGVWIDSPNMLLHWCKSKKKQSMIFKIDFEKAYDSVRWDYLDDVLNNFRFGTKWRGWIQNCLHSSRGSILVNKSPTDEFQFQKGLKQRDPLSLFLFILIMKSLHLSFQKLVDEGLFKGRSLSSSLQLSHLFYVDDVIFMGQWSDSNITTIVHALKCFHKASGLRMNLHKSTLLGVFVVDEKVNRAALKMGCSTFKMPFSYLGIKVGGLMSRINSWDEVVTRVYSRLSKWKMKTLSIGGRLTLLKSVLGLTPIYYMSMFKVSSQVLKILEAIRCQFFNGADSKEKKMSFIKALHGEDGKLGKLSKLSHPSVWMNIVNELYMLKNQDMDLLSLMKKRVGNGIDTLFWEEAWRGEVTFKSCFPRVYALESNKMITVTAKLAHADLGYSLRRTPRDGAEMMQFLDLKANIDGVQLPSMQDRWTWSLVGSGDFSVASARKYIDDHLLLSSPSRTRWVKAVPIKIISWLGKSYPS
ncbi:RNA-directed DNA polymerase, eukaryota, reverse transcriptase zinc-binding domain protein [Tanacetum coccineum]